MKFWHHTIAKPYLNCQAQSCFNSKLQMPCHWYNVAGSYQYVHHWTPGQKHVPCSLTFRQQATSAGEVFQKLGIGKAFVKQGQVQSWKYCCRFARCLACQAWSEYQAAIAWCGWELHVTPSHASNHEDTHWDTHWMVWKGPIQASKHLPKDLWGGMSIHKLAAIFSL